jgi:hypothetical protein
MVYHDRNNLIFIQHSQLYQVDILLYDSHNPRIIIVYDRDTSNHSKFPNISFHHIHHLKIALHRSKQLLASLQCNFGISKQSSVLFKHIIQSVDSVIHDLLYHWAFNRLQNVAAHKIAAAWKKCIVDPYHPIGRRRLLYEFKLLKDLTT